jgi:hypothetical protein
MDFGAAKMVLGKPGLRRSSHRAIVAEGANLAGRCSLRRDSAIEVDG